MNAACRLSRLQRLIHRLALSISISVAAMPAVVGAEEKATVAVGLRNGKVFIGLVDSRANEQQLWLRTSRAGVELRRPIDWENILLVRQGNREFSAAEFRVEVLSSQTTATSLRMNEADELPAPSVVTAQNESSQGPAQVGANAGAVRPKEWLPDRRMAQFIQAARANNTQVCSLSIDAQVANLNRTVEADGLVLHIYPLDGAGNMIPVDGTLDVELIASVPPGWPRGEPPPNIGHWSFRLIPQQFGPAGAIVKLPFQGVHPEFDLNLGPFGLVHARLSIPGNGSFRSQPGGTANTPLQRDPRPIAAYRWTTVLRRRASGPTRLVMRRRKAEFGRRK